MLLVAVHARADAPVWAGRDGCRVLAPAGWNGSQLAWDGACAGGKASGRGVLRGYRKAGAPRLFLGVVEQGEPSLGVIEAEGGYIAGRFGHGKLLPNQDRNDIIRAFDEASAAARDFGERLRKAGNRSSAEFYLKKAQQLEQQMD